MLRVEIDLDGVVRTVGRLAWRDDERRAYFEFDRGFLDRPLPLSPFRLDPKPGVIAAGHTPFEGLHGLFNDSLPDGWGRKLLDRSLQRRGYGHRLLAPLDRLAAVGTRGMGALRYIPELPLDDAHAEGTADIDWLADQARMVEEDVPEADVDKLRQAEGNSGGVRPKVVVAYDPASRLVRYDDGTRLPEGFSHWLIKFRARDDPAEFGAEEYAYALMARAAGVTMPNVDLMRTKLGTYFAVRRFDREGVFRRHVHTASGLVDADHRAAGTLDYEMLLRITRALTKDMRQVVQMFTRMTFNVLARNRDDHAKNHAFLMRSDGGWEAAPAYDITFSTGPAGEHNLTLAGEGRRPGKREILAVAADAGISRADAATIFDEVRSTVDRWPDFANEAGLSGARTSEIDAALK
ncbi:serine/threonine-protein kinase HipA [Rhizobiales bacterium GAS113]|nr:serine/threonine-protein kinase HipA [Rhizobiales bacterium GAS113]SEE53895.1 serine/threonine-protein kinase HipA [Rhizobiales bacterium GAS188]